MGTYHYGTSGADTLSETSYNGDTLVGGLGGDTYTCWASSWWKSGFPEYGIPGETVYYRTRIVENAGQGYDTVHYHIGINGIVVSGSELPSIERIYLVNQLGDSGTFQLLLGDGPQLVYGSTALEKLSGGGGNDTISGLGGNDSLMGGDGMDSLLGGNGSDTLDGGTSADHMAGGSGNDVYFVQNAGDVTTEAAGGGIDTVYTAVSDTLDANVENLVLGAGNINGTGNVANNWLYAGTGNNVLSGGGGVDTVSFKLGVSASGVTASLATGSATGGSGSDAINGFRHLEGTLYGDSLQGNLAANRLIGLSGADTLSGAGGNDTLLGGAGADQLTGGTGSDTFRFEAATDAYALGLLDVVWDFASGVDRIDLSGIDANPGVVGDQAFTFEQLGYDPALGILYADVAGGAADEVRLRLYESGGLNYPSTVLVEDIVL